MAFLAQSAGIRRLIPLPSGRDNSPGYIAFRRLSSGLGLWHPFSGALKCCGAVFPASVALSSDLCFAAIPFPKVSLARFCLPSNLRRLRGNSRT